VQSALAGDVPLGSRVYYSTDGQPILLYDPVILRGNSITYASATTAENGQPAVSVRLGGGGENLFIKTTAQNVGKPMAIVYVETKSEQKMINGKMVTVRHQDEKVISAPVIQQALFNQFQITNLTSMQYAQNLALLLRSGALVAPVDIIQSRTVGPTLGKANIKMGIDSVIIGSLLVIIFMTLYYRFMGVIANFAIILNVIFIVAVLSLLGATLTMPGIAAIVLTVGMAVDANVLINERIREELRNGVSPQASIHAGYERAFTTIVDANVTTLIVAVVLFALGSVNVKGFAVSLIIGLLASMITSIFFTRSIVNLTYGRKRYLKKVSIGITVKEGGR